MNYKQAAKIESYPVEFGQVGVQINVSIDRELTWDENYEIRLLAEKIEKMLRMGTALANPETLVRQKDIRDKFNACFDCQVFMKQIPNEYCPNYCCVDKPWFIVQTKKGAIKIGWRKRVISIDWKDSDIKATADELFPDEDTTKAGQLIHAWGYDKAKEYITILMKD